MRRIAILTSSVVAATLLASCSGGPGLSDPAARPTQSASSAAPTESADSSSSEASTVSLKDSCLKFNELAAKARQLSYPDNKAYLDLYSEPTRLPCPVLKRPREHSLR